VLDILFNIIKREVGSKCFINKKKVGFKNLYANEAPIKKQEFREFKKE
jgi:hypothetical protein